MESDRLLAILPPLLDYALGDLYAAENEYGAGDGSQEKRIHEVQRLLGLDIYCVGCSYQVNGEITDRRFSLVDGEWRCDHCGAIEPRWIEPARSSSEVASDDHAAG